MSYILNNVSYLVCHHNPQSNALLSVDVGVCLSWRPVCQYHSALTVPCKLTFHTSEHSQNAQLVKCERLIRIHAIENISAFAVSVKDEQVSSWLRWEFTKDNKRLKLDWTDLKIFLESDKLFDSNLSIYLSIYLSTYLSFYLASLIFVCMYLIYLSINR